MPELQEILPILLPLIIIQVILMIIAIIDWAKNGSLVGKSRWIWLVVILFLNTIGPIIYFIFGRRKD